MDRGGVLTFAVGGALVAAAWFGATLVPAGTATAVVSVLPEGLGLLVLLGAVRLRLHRSVLASLVLIGGHLGLRLLDPGSAELSAVLLVVALNLVLLAPLADRGLGQTWSLLHLLLVLSQPGLLWLALAHLGPVREAASSGALSAVPWAVAAAGAALLVVALVRRGAFEVALLWGLVATAAAVLGAGSGLRGAALFDAAQATLLMALVEQGYRLAFHDGLTGLANRRAFDEALRTVSGRYALGMVDIDHFKQFNDRWGHEAGDQALRMVARELTRVGGGGRVFRYGGEEFAVLFGNLEASQAVTHLETVRAAIEQRGFSVRGAGRPNRPPRRREKSSGTRVTLTVSAGLASPDPTRGSPDAVLRAADRALYRAKRSGRNRVAVT